MSQYNIIFVHVTLFFVIITTNDEDVPVTWPCKEEVAFHFNPSNLSICGMGIRQVLSL